MKGRQFRKNPAERKLHFTAYLRKRRHDDNNGVNLACGLHCHASKSEARGHVKRLRRLNNDPLAHRLRPFFCGRCEQWHVGHDLPRSLRGAVLTASPQLAQGA